VDGFAVFVFVNDESHWAELRQSFADAGFDRPERLSDEDTNPYEMITRLGTAGGYAILCHQDVRFDQGMGEPELRERIDALSIIDPCWTVAGNAGVTREGRVFWGPQDSLGYPRADDCPAEVVSLDENFLVLNCNRAPRCSPGLSGFHFYGTDVCLNALRDGGTAYVIDVRMTHLSTGNRNLPYDESRHRLLSVWNRRSWFRYIGTTTTTLFMSRSAVLRRVFGSARALAWVSLLREPS
jgi:hypothetical protein